MFSKKKQKKQSEFNALHLSICDSSLCTSLSRNSVFLWFKLSCAASEDVYYVICTSTLSILRKMHTYTHAYTCTHAHTHSHTNTQTHTGIARIVGHESLIQTMTIAGTFWFCKSQSFSLVLLAHATWMTFNVNFVCNICHFSFYQTILSKADK